jgi:broad specificity phosphatase PhoE
VRRLCILRHGQSEWNTEQRWQGWIDVPLTALGEAQARARAAQLAAGSLVVPTVFASDLARAQRTAEALAAALGARVVTDPGFRERNGGEFQGLTATEIDERWPGLRDRWRAGEVTAPPGGESDDDLRARFDAALARLVASTAADHDAVLVTHGGVLRVVARRAGISGRDVTENVGGYWFRIDGEVLVADEPLPAIVHDGALKVE